MNIVRSTHVLTTATALAFAMVSSTAAAQAGAVETSHPGAAILGRAYTLRDRAIDEMNREARDWANLFRNKEDYSDDMIEPEHGLITSGSAGPSEASQIFVSVSFAVKRIVGDRRSVCERHLRLFANAFHGIVPKDAFGEPMNVKKMRWRLGPAGMTDDPAITVAAKELLRQTTLRLSIVEMDTNATIECRLGVTKGVTFIDTEAP